MDAKTQFLLSHFSEEEIKSIEDGTYMKGEIHKFGLLPEDITYGIEFEYLLKPEHLPEMCAYLLRIHSISGIQTDCSEETDDIYFSKLLKNSVVKIPNSIINEMSTPPLHDNEKSMYYLMAILAIIEQYSVPVPNSYRRNIHVHFDKKVLGDKYEYLRPLLMVMRGYENIIYRLACAETGIPPKAGLSDRIAEVLKKEKVGEMLKTYNGKLDWYTFVQARDFGLNLANARCHYLGLSPAFVSKKSDKGLMDIIFNNTRIEPNSKKNIKKGEMVVKEIPPTIEFRLTPVTCNMTTLQSDLLLYNIVLGMARNLKDNKELGMRVLARNKVIDESGPDIFNVEFDTEGISDMISWLPEDKKDLGKRLLVDYAQSKPLLKLNQIPRTEEETIGKPNLEER